MNSDLQTYTCIVLLDENIRSTRPVMGFISGTLCWKNVIHASTCSYLLGIHVATFNKQQLATSSRSWPVLSCNFLIIFHFIFVLFLFIAITSFTSLHQNLCRGTFFLTNKYIDAVYFFSPLTYKNVAEILLNYLTKNIYQYPASFCRDVIFVKSCRCSNIY